MSCWIVAGRGELEYYSVMLTSSLLLEIRKHSTFYLALAIFLVSLVLKSTQFTTPPIDAHPMRQTDTACVIHFFATASLNILEPKTCLIRPTTNLEGLFFLEFPAYEWLVAVFQRLIHSQDWWTVRVFNLVLFSIGFWSLYSGCRRYYTDKIALFSVLVFTWMPSAIFFYGQAIHPDIFMITTLLLSWNLLTLYTTSAKGWQLAAYVVLLGLSIATRPFVALALPGFALVMLQHKKWLGFFVTIALPVLPYLAWTEWQKSFPEASHDWQGWVLTGREQLFLFEPLKNLIWKNIVGEVIGKVTALLSLLGLVVAFFNKDRLRYLFCLVYILGIPLYWYIAPAGNIAHQYYAHVFTFPFILLAALGLEQLYEKSKTRKLFLVLFLLLIGGLIYNGYRTSRYFYVSRTSNEEWQMTAQISAMVPQGSKVIYLGQSSLPFSLAFRQGWNIARPPADLHRNAESITAAFANAQYLILPHYDGTFPPEETAKLVDKLQVISESEWGIIYKIK